MITIKNTHKPSYVVTIMDEYKEEAKHIANHVLVDFTDDALHDAKYNRDYYKQKYISEYIYKDNLIQTHYQLIGYLSLESKEDYSVEEIVSKFKLDDRIIKQATDYSNIIDLMDDAVLEIVYKVLDVLVEKELKTSKFKG